MLGRFVVSHRPYERLKLRAGINTGQVIAGVQVSLIFFISFHCQNTNLNTTQQNTTVGFDMKMTLQTTPSHPQHKLFWHF